jgi:flavodoxin
MKALVIYDSVYGNTKIIAEKIAKELGNNSKAISISDFNTDDLKDTSLLIVGSPINGWRPTEKITKWLASLTSEQLKNIKATSFDTRIKLFIHGDAMNKIAKSLKGAGAEIIVPPTSFIVKGNEGPLLDGEIQKAIDWTNSIKANFK